MRKISKLIATLFYVGYIPLAPGTLASALAIPIYILLRNNQSAYFIITAIFLCIGFWAANTAVVAFKEKDPSEIVIDEFSSQLIVYLFLPFSPKIVVLGFILFRILDIFKIPPIKKLESLPKGWGIMLDDIAAAILANIILHLISFFNIPYLS